MLMYDYEYESQAQSAIRGSDISPFNAPVRRRSRSRPRLETLDYRPRLWRMQWLFEFYVRYSPAILFSLVAFIRPFTANSSKGDETIRRIWKFTKAAVLGGL